jgi:D-alanyl-D-alanine carboxypeptidase (penicillin-binding protein 5/6)
LETKQVVELDGWWKFFRLSLLTAAAAGIFLVRAGAAGASTRHRHAHSHHQSRHVRHAPLVLYKGALLEDAESGKVLYADNPDMQWPPASMAKMMLLLVAEDELGEGRAHLDDPVRISERSAHTMGSRVGLVEGKVYPLRELMKAALIKSANDAAVAVAEKIGGSVEAAVRMMNARARSLGMTNTEYHTVDGLPPRPGHDVDHTSARDLATVARQLIYNTNLLKWSSLEQAPFDGGVCMLHNTNHLVGHFEGCDGLKTGFTYQAGFNLTATAKRGGLRLIVVVLGAPSNPQRFAQAAKLLQWGFTHYTAVSLLRSGQPLPVQVQADQGKVIQPVAAAELRVVMPKDEVNSLRVDYRVPMSVSGPVRKGDPLGKVIARDGSVVLNEIAVISPVAVNLPVQDDNGWNPPGAAAYNQEYPRFQESQ